jgi:hypothetical protein
MSTLIFYGSLFIAAIVLVSFVASKIPGLDHIWRPIVGLLFTAVEAALTNLWAWSIFMIKTLLFSHVDLVRHLILSSDQIDPSHGLKEEYERS